LILWELASCHNQETEQCNPGYRYLSRMTGLSQPRMSGWINELVELGDIEMRNNGRGSRNHYVLLFMENDEVSPSGNHSEVSPSRNRVSPSRKKVSPSRKKVIPSGTRNQEGNQELNQEESSAARSLSKNSPNGERSTPSFFCTRCYPTRHETKRCPVPVVDQAEVELDGMGRPVDDSGLSGPF
jgi:hypothetical protein